VQTGSASQIKRNALRIQVSANDNNTSQYAKLILVVYLFVSSASGDKV
jgi:hypothetical protein